MTNMFSAVVCYVFKLDREVVDGNCVAMDLAKTYLITRDDGVDSITHATLATFATRGESTKEHAKCIASRTKWNVAELRSSIITLTDTDSACIRGPFGDVGAIRGFVPGYNLGRRGLLTRVFHGIPLPVLNNLNGLVSWNVVGDDGGGGHCIVYLK